ncbi:uncharacterized protein [Typha angustifolia]|uniref:uncharacterized protein n=1 Tax=Typha angustifolia TaxID=59011 RepID=UPI003C2FF554
MLLSLRPSPYLPLRRFFCNCSSTADMARYKEAFARRMTMAGIKPHHRIALGVSGGPDSMALCVLTAGWKLDGSVRKDEALGYIDGLLGIVVDHGLRAESSEEAKLVRDRVNKMGIRCEIACCNWPDGRPKQGHLQEAAREMRYQKFQDVCMKQQIGILLIAHHADDQAELLILRLSRNSGVLGLAGMAFVSQLFPTHLKYCGENRNSCGILLVRPMLEFSKDDMYKICGGGDQVWVEDPTNQSMSFARNRIRASLRSLSSGAFRSQLQGLISACRLTRAYVDHICHKMIKQSLTIMEHGYAMIDLEKLKPLDVGDLCLSQYLASILQFISQRHRPIRGSTARLVIDYIRKLPCKTSLTAAGCYLCPAPQSKGLKILICCSVDSPYSSRIGLSYKYSCEEEGYFLPREIDQMIKEGNMYSDESLLKSQSIPFMTAKSYMDVLNEAEKLNLISQSTLEDIALLGVKENEKFSSTMEVKYDQEPNREIKFDGPSCVTIHPGQTCHFMNRFLVTWKSLEVVKVDGLSSVGSEDQFCQLCMVDQEITATIRHMVDSDWLFLAEVSKSQILTECQEKANISTNETQQNGLENIKYSNYMQLSAKSALHALKSIPASARRGLPVLVNSQGLPLSIPSICFRCCPRLSVAVVFKPKVPLGRGHTSYI